MEAIAEVTALSRVQTLEQMHRLTKRLELQRAFGRWTKFTLLANQDMLVQQAHRQMAEMDKDHEALVGMLAEVQQERDSMEQKLSDLRDESARTLQNVLLKLQSIELQSSRTTKLLHEQHTSHALEMNRMITVNRLQRNSIFLSRVALVLRSFRHRRMHQAWAAWREHSLVQGLLLRLVDGVAPGTIRPGPANSALSSPPTTSPITSHLPPPSAMLSSMSTPSLPTVPESDTGGNGSNLGLRRAGGLSAIHSAAALPTVTSLGAADLFHSSPSSPKAAVTPKVSALQLQQPSPRATPAVVSPRGKASPRGKVGLPSPVSLGLGSSGLGAAIAAAAIPAISSPGASSGLMPTAVQRSTGETGRHNLVALSDDELAMAIPPQVLAAAESKPPVSRVKPNMPPLALGTSDSASRFNV
jgi:hypothetical protein